MAQLVVLTLVTSSGLEHWVMSSNPTLGFSLSMEPYLEKKKKKI